MPKFITIEDSSGRPHIVNVDYIALIKKRSDGTYDYILSIPNPNARFRVIHSNYLLSFFTSGNNH